MDPLKLALITVMLCTCFTGYDAVAPKADKGVERPRLKRQYESLSQLKQDGNSGKVKQIVPNYSNGHDHSIAKRNLPWDGKQIVGTDDYMTVNYFQSYSQSEQACDNDDYIGFILYQRNNKHVVTRTGLFHYVKMSTAYANAAYCPEKTNHSGAYYVMYNKCPSELSGLVASGHCYIKGKFNFNSRTFNCIQSYSRETFYDPGPPEIRSTNNIEQAQFKVCFDQWRREGCQLRWKCALSDSIAIKSTNDEPQYCSASDPCDGCDGKIGCSESGSNHVRSMSSSVIMFVALCGAAFFALF